MELRPYQSESIAALWDWFRTNPQGAPLLVLPTGSGKSLVIAEAAKHVAKKGGDRRVLILAHRKELLGQNYEKLSQLMPWGRLGLYSAGLNRKDANAQVVVAGIQSVFKKAEELGKFSLVIIDEVHLVPPDGEGRYQTLIRGLQEQNPAVRLTGLNATPYRLKSGLLVHQDSLWTDFAYEANIRDLIAQGYLCPLVSKAGVKKVNLSRVSVRAGEYNQAELEEAFNRHDLVEAAVEEIIALGADRKSWLVFAAGILHAEKVAEAFKKGGVTCGVVTGDTPPILREQTLQDFKARALRAVVNVDVLTTGFDHPGIDLIAVLRATKSTALWVQICGRGCRIAEGKKNCLILDYGDNAMTHGPIDRIAIRSRRNPLTDQTEYSLDTPPTKECAVCRSVVALAQKVCPDCGYEFPNLMRLNHQAEASDAPILSQPSPVIEVEIYKVNYDKHQKADKPLPTLRVDYSIAVIDENTLKKVSEWVCLEHQGFAGKKAMAWWVERTTNLCEAVPATIDAALKRVEELKVPKKLAVQKEGKFWRVVKVLEWAEPEKEFDPVEELGVNF